MIFATAAIPAATLPGVALAQPQSFDFGDDAGDYAKDGECDDLRFSGPGMTDTPLLADDVAHDATDCQAAFYRGELSFNPMYSTTEGINWGDDDGDYANDGECDDMRFKGEGMTDTPLLAEDIGHDASDCSRAFQAGKLRWNGGAVPKQNL